MKQPRKDILREQLVLAAEEQIRLRQLLVDAFNDAEEMRRVMAWLSEVMKRRWWHRFAWWRK